MAMLTAARRFVQALMVSAALLVSPAGACVVAQDPSNAVFSNGFHPQATFVRARVTGVEALPEDFKIEWWRTRAARQERQFVSLDIEVIEHLGGRHSTPTRVLLGSMPAYLKWQLPVDLAAFQAQFPGEVYLGIYRLDPKDIAARKVHEQLAALLTSMPIVIGDVSSCGPFLALAPAADAAGANINEWGFLSQLKRRGWIKP
jgi:hypothetical protein